MKLSVAMLDSATKSPNILFSILEDLLALAIEEIILKLSLVAIFLQMVMKFAETISFPSYSGSLKDYCPVGCSDCDETICDSIFPESIDGAASGFSVEPLAIFESVLDVSDINRATRINYSRIALHNAILEQALDEGAFGGHNRPAAVRFTVQHFAVVGRPGLFELVGCLLSFCRRKANLEGRGIFDGQICHLRVELIQLSCRDEFLFRIHVASRSDRQLVERDLFSDFAAKRSSLCSHFGQSRRPVLNITVRRVRRPRCA